MAYDAHCHLDFEHTPDGALERARDADVTGFCVAGADPAHWDRLRAVARQTGAHVALGLHPWFVADAGDDWRDLLDTLVHTLSQPDVDALGELGLDRPRAESTGSPESAMQRQVEVFRAQLAIAREHDRPIVLHSVRTDEQVLQTLREDGVPAAGGLVHAFSGGPPQARAFVELGLHVSFGLRVVQNDVDAPTLGRRAAAAVRAIPPDRLLVETDAPEVSIDDVPCEPAHVWRVLRACARATDSDPDALAEQTETNARSLFPRRTGPLDVSFAEHAAGGSRTHDG